MNSKEVIDSLLRTKKGPRMGLHDSPWAETLTAWADEGYPINSETGKPENPSVALGFDMEGVGGGFDWMPKQGFNEIIDETDQWEVRLNGAGAALKWWKHKSGTPEHVDFRMASRDIWEKEYRPAVKACESRMNAENDRKALQSARERGVWASFGNQGLWECMRASYGDICMFESFLLDPEWVKDFNRVYTDFYKGMYDLLFAKAGLPDGVWLYDDLAYKNGTYCSPKALDELFAPYYKEIADHVHSYGLPIVFHCCGGMEEALTMIAESGYDALNPMERKAGCDPLKFAKKYGDRMAFIGGLNAVTLESGDMDRIIRETDLLIDGMKEMGAAYVFGSDHSLSPRIRYSDYKKTIDYFRSRAEY